MSHLDWCLPDLHLGYLSIIKVLIPAAGLPTHILRVRLVVPHAALIVAVTVIPPLKLFRRVAAPVVGFIFKPFGLLLLQVMLVPAG